MGSVTSGGSEGSVDPALLAKLEQIVDAGIQLVPAPELMTHFLFERDGAVVLVERRGETLGMVGSPGLLGDHGFAALVQRDGADWFIGKTLKRAATAEEAAHARKLYAELRAILG
jgi:hypothetical protein